MAGAARLFLRVTALSRICRVKYIKGHDRHGMCVLIKLHDYSFNNLRM